ncbi:unnamed protein product [Cuscuta campestris]|uniref:CCHC-type domain-containing protein n=1 Tax=Cuscuta campestris TaxID=132261 RepID=A0A484KIC4_9ASTE|nr:unnamed protein product [Cuscuta campestris]
MNFLQQMAGAYVPSPPPPPPPVAVVTIEKLWKNGAEEFLGDQIADPMIAKRWFERTIRVLGNVRVPQEQRGDLAVALLQDSAYDWWKRVGAGVPEPVQWATFDRLFHEEYIPEHFVEAKREEFLKFTQGELTLPDHPGECWYTLGLCLGCGQAGHFRKDCPKNPGEAFSTAPAAPAPAAQPAQSQKSAAASSQPKRQASGAQAGKARTYAMRGRTEQPAHDVIMGMFTLFDTSITALIDPGSTLSYVYMPMPVMPNIPRENLDNPVLVSNPLGHSLRLTHVYHDCPLVVRGKIFPASLIELPHREFDVILGMDWLTANQAVVEYGVHTVRLRAEDGSDVLIHGELLPKAQEFISYIHARRLIRKNCEAFLCTVRDTCQEVPGRGDIPTKRKRISIRTRLGEKRVPFSSSTKGNSGSRRGGGREGSARVKQAVRPLSVH